MTALDSELARIAALAEELPPSFELTWAFWLESVSPKAREEIVVASNHAEELEQAIPRLVAVANRLRAGMDDLAKMHLAQVFNPKEYIANLESELFVILKGEKP